MNEAVFTAKLVAFFVAVVFLEQCAGQPKDFYIELVDNTDDLEIASLNYSIEKTNSNTSNHGNNSFTLKITNVSRHTEDLYQRASALLQQDVVALIDGHNSSVSACVLSMFTEIPLIRLHGDRYYWDKCRHVGVSLSASYASYARATVQLLDTFHWTEVAILYEESFTHEAHYFETFANKEKPRLHFLKLHKQRNETMDDAVTRAMKRLSALNVRVVLLYAQELYQHKLLSKIPLNLIVHPSDMVVGFRLPRKKTQTSGDYEDNLRSNANVTKPDFFSLKDRVVLEHDAGQVLAQALADMSNEEDWVQMINGTTQYAPVFNRRSLLQHLKKVRLQGMTGSIQFDKSGLRTSIHLDVMNLQNKSIVKVGSWSSAKLILAEDLLKDKGKDRGGSNLEGKRLRVVTVEAAPFVIKSPGSSGKNITKYEGYCIDILDKLASDLKFTYEIGQSTDGNYGAESEGVWNGMIGDLVRKKADIAVAALTVTNERGMVVDFTVAHMPTSSGMIMKNDVVEETDFLQFMMPFKIPVWVMVLVCLSVMTLTIFTLNYFSPYGYKDEEGKGTSPEFNLFNSFWFALACMLQQGGDNTPKSLSGRILTGFYWFCILTWVSTYTANLVAFLAVKIEQHPVQNLEDALESGYDITVTSSSSSYEFFRSSKSELYQKIWRHMESKNAYAKNAQEGIDRVRKGKQIYITDGPVLAYAAGKEPCDLVSIPALTKDDSLGFAMQTNNPHVRDISLAMLRLRQTGYLAILYRKWWYGTNKCPEPDGVVSGKQISLTSMAGVYMVLAVGLLVSFAVLGAEIVWFKKAGKEKMKAHMESMGKPKVISSVTQDNQDDATYDLPMCSM